MASSRPQNSSPEEAATGSTPRKRRRAKVACEPCRERKRRCNGHLPCETCMQYEYDCFYNATKKGKMKFAPLNSQPRAVEYANHNQLHASPPTLADGAATVDNNNVAAPARIDTNKRMLRKDQQADIVSTNDTNITTVNTHLESLEANSGAAFVRRLGLKIDPSNAPRLHLFAWNTGDRLVGCPHGTVRTVTNMLSKTEMRNLASVYFDKVADVYGFIDQDAFFQRVEERWRTPPSTVPNNNTYDPVLCAVAAFGFLFGQKRPARIEPDLVETARTLLEQHSRCSPCSVDTVTGWVVFVAYLRMSSLPHTTWLASCSMMHVVEATSIHIEPSEPSNTIFERPSSSSSDIEINIRRRLWGMAQHLHIWASFDLGRTKISIAGTTTKPVTLRPGDLTTQLLGFIPLTDLLDPNKTRSVADFEADMTLLLAEDRSDPRVILAQVNLMLCIFRRLRAQKSNMLNLQMDLILTLAMKGIRAVQQLIADVCPWQHAANVPFQVICLLLAIDTRASLALLGEAMRTLQHAASTWDTPVMREACSTAYLLILLHHRCKEEDAKTLREVLARHSTALDSASSSTNTYDYTSNNSYNQNNADYPLEQQQLQPAMPTDSAEFLWLEGLISDMPRLREFDLEQFLLQDASQLPDMGIMSGGVGGSMLR